MQSNISNQYEKFKIFLNSPTKAKPLNLSFLVSTGVGFSQIQSVIGVGLGGLTLDFISLQAKANMVFECFGVFRIALLWTEIHLDSA